MQNPYESLLSKVRSKSYRVNSDAAVQTTEDRKLHPTFDNQIINTFKPALRKRNKLHSLHTRTGKDYFIPANDFSTQSRTLTTDISDTSLLKGIYAGVREVNSKKSFLSSHVKPQTSNSITNNTISDFATIIKSSAKKESPLDSTNTVRNVVDASINTRFHKTERFLLKLTRYDTTLHVYSPGKKAETEIAARENTSNSPVMQKSNSKKLRKVRDRSGPSYNIEAESFEPRNRRLSANNSSNFSDSNVATGGRKMINLGVPHIPSRGTVQTLSGGQLSNNALRSEQSIIRTRSRFNSLEKPMRPESFTETRSKLEDKEKKSSPEKELGDNSKRKQKVYWQVATLDERERMSRFLNDEYINKRLLTRYHLHLDKYQIKDTLEKIKKKAEQDRDLRNKFNIFMQTNNLNLIREQGSTSKLPSKNQIVEFVGLQRKLSETIIATEESAEDGMQTEEAENSRMSRVGNKSSVRKRRQGLREGGPKSTRSDEDDEEKSKGNNIHIKEEAGKSGVETDVHTREFDRIKLMRVNKTLNAKLVKTVLPNIESLQYTNESDLMKEISEQEEFYLFMKAIKARDLKLASEFIERNRGFVFETDLLKQTALHHAAREGQLRICKLLIESGADPNAKDTGDKTPLYYALTEKHNEIVQLLMSLKGSLLAAKDVKYEGLREGIDMIKSLKKARPSYFMPAKGALRGRESNEMQAQTRGSISMDYGRRRSSVAPKIVPIRVVEGGI